MIRSPLGLRLVSDGTFKEQLREAAALGARGVVLDAIAEFSPDRLSETGRREVRHALRAAEIGLVAVSLPTRRPFDTIDQLEDRLARADRAFTLAYELGTRLVLCRVGAVPPESEPERRETFRHALAELARRADHRGIRFAVEAGGESGADLRAFLDALAAPSLAASIDPSAALSQGLDPVEQVTALAEHVAHAYAADAAGRPRPGLAPNPRGFGFAPGVLDWEAYCGSLEEIGYGGFLTVWPDPNLPARPQFEAVRKIVERF